MAAEVAASDPAKSCKIEAHTSIIKQVGGLTLPHAEALTIELFWTTWPVTGPVSVATQDHVDRRNAAFRHQDASTRSHMMLVVLVVLSPIQWM